MLPFRAGKFFRDFPDFLYRPNGVRELRQRVRPDGRLLVCTDPAGCTNCVSVFALTGGSFSAPAERGARTALACSPFPGGSFSAPESRGARTASACSPFPGGKFFAEPQRGDSPSADGGSVAAPAAGAKRKDNLRFSFLFELLPVPCFLIWRRFPRCDRFENRERQSGYRSVSFAACSQCQIHYCYTGRLLPASAT